MPEAGRVLLVHRGDHDHAGLLGEGLHPLGGRAVRDVLRVGVVLGILHLAEVGPVEQLLEQDDLGTLLRRLVGVLLVLLDHRLLVAGPGGLDQGATDGPGHLRSSGSTLAHTRAQTLARPIRRGWAGYTDDRWRIRPADDVRRAVRTLRGHGRARRARGLEMTSRRADAGQAGHQLEPHRVEQLDEGCRLPADPSGGESATRRRRDRYRSRAGPGRPGSEPRLMSSRPRSRRPGRRAGAPTRNGGDSAAQRATMNASMAMRGRRFAPTASMRTTRSAISVQFRAHTTRCWRVIRRAGRSSR